MFPMRIYKIPRLLTKKSKISDILASNIVPFLDPIADSEEILTYSDKYSVFNINYYISIPWIWVISDES